MFRFVSPAILLVGFIYLTAFRVENPFQNDRSFVFNTTIAKFFFEETRTAPFEISSDAFMVPDSAITMRLLLLNPFSYDSAYPNKAARLISRRLPSTTITPFWNGSSSDLESALSGQDAILLVYPYEGPVSEVQAVGKVIRKFVNDGGHIIITGTHKYSILQSLALFDLDYGYYCKDIEVHPTQAEHPILAGTETDFVSTDFTYPLDISDAQFNVLAEIKGYPTAGFKSIGAGKVVYLGLEYYHEEKSTSNLLINTLKWLAPAQSVYTNSFAAKGGDALKVVKRTEETLYTGSGKKEDLFSIHTYPNPYIAKATLEIDLKKSNAVTVEMTDETGRLVANLLPSKNLNQGIYQIEIPGNNIAPGIYFITCQIGTQKSVKKVVKTAE